TLCCCLALSHTNHDLHSFPTRRSSDLFHFPNTPKPYRLPPDLSASLLNGARRANRLFQFLTAFRGLPVEPGFAGLSQHDADSATDRKSTRLNSSHVKTSYAVFCLKQKR